MASGACARVCMRVAAVFRVDGAHCRRGDRRYCRLSRCQTRRMYTITTCILRRLGLLQGSMTCHADASCCQSYSASLSTIIRYLLARAAVTAGKFSHITPVLTSLAPLKLVNVSL